MDFFSYRKGRLHAEDVPVEELAAAHGTPLYVYSAGTIVDHFRKLRDAFPGATICYSVKANPNLSILKLVRDEGCGFDVTSAGELHRALKVGADPKKIAFAGVAKTDEEIDYALETGIALFTVESEQELETIDRLSKAKGKVADVALRINPDVDPHTHVHITTGKKENKFGTDLDRARQVMKKAAAMTGVRMRGVHIHIGSQLTKFEPYVEALTRVASFIRDCAALGVKIDTIDMGGGFGIWYKEKLARPAKEIAGAILPVLQKTGCRIFLEPGRFIVGNGGVLLTRVVYVKESGDKRFVICDAGMNDLIRPALYGAYHRIWPVTTEASVEGPAPDEEAWKGAAVTSDVVGPICESTDAFAKDRKLPPVKRGDLLCIFSAGAYAFSMASTYNSHPRPAEVMVAGKGSKVVGVRETLEDLTRLERIEAFKVS